MTIGGICHIDLKGWLVKKQNIQKIIIKKLLPDVTYISGNV